MFAIRYELLKKAIEDKETSKRLEQAESWLEIQIILEEFAKKQGAKVKRI
jgi:hypothetical protein